MKPRPFVTVLMFFMFAVSMVGYSQSERPTINICCNTGSDLYVLLRKENVNLRIYRTPGQAISHAMDGTGVLLLADSYPTKRVSVSSSMLELARKKKLRLYIEYPASLQGLAVPDTVATPHMERGVVVSDVFGNALKPMSILGVNDCHVIPVNVKDPLVVFGKVAGFDKAVYGVSDVKTYPLLFQDGNMLVAMTRLSSFATSRYEPSDSWKVVWDYILSWITHDQNFRLSGWLSYVSPMYGRDQPLPADAMGVSIKKGVDWFFKGHFFVAQSWKKMYLKYEGNGLSPIGPPVKRSWPNGNGSLGILEGQVSHIYYDGDQEYRYWVRADNQGQVAYALTAAGNYLHIKRYDMIAANLADFIFYHSDLRSGAKNDPNSPVFGLIGWAVTHPDIFYGDDNARLLLGLIGAEAYLKTDRWDKQIAEAIMANFRTTGREGFRGERLEQDSILAHGWRYYWDRNIVDPHPHYEAWMWACYLWLYSKTGYKPLLTRTEMAIRITMQDYPNEWLWTNGLQQERARMILPLAWLVRVENTAEHRKWLNEVVSDMLKYQAPCGAIREELGPPGNGAYGPPKTNAAYGTGEASLIFRNGEPVADMLYTNNFAFFSLNEAAHATKNEKYIAAERRLADFLMRIQVKSVQHKDLDGAWFRAFDYGIWDYWASNGDAGWGAWSTNTGWIQSWMVSTEVLRERGESFWTLTKNSAIKNDMPHTVDIMFGDGNK
jgi:hypothetical protein